MDSITVSGPEPQAAWQPPRDAQGRTDWDALKQALPPRDPALGFERNWEEKRASEERLVSLAENNRKAEEAKLLREQVKRGIAPRTPADLARWSGARSVT